MLNGHHQRLVEGSNANVFFQASSNYDIRMLAGIPTHRFGAPTLFGRFGSDFSPRFMCLCGHVFISFSIEGSVIAALILNPLMPILFFADFQIYFAGRVRRMTGPNQSTPRPRAWVGYQRRRSLCRTTTPDNGLLASKAADSIAALSSSLNAMDGGLLFLLLALCCNSFILIFSSIRLVIVLHILSVILCDYVPTSDLSLRGWRILHWAFPAYPILRSPRADFLLANPLGFGIKCEHTWES